MTLPMQQEWEDASLRLFGDEYAFVATGARVHGDWCIDAISVLAREVPDPRGWITLDWDAVSSADSPQRRPPFPFVLPAGLQLRECVNEITSSAAVKLVVALVDEWFKVQDIPAYVERKEQLLEDARTLLARYGPDCAYYTTAADARVTDNPDFFRVVSPGVGLTDHLLDLGLFVVSDAEVGVIWRFNAN